MNVDAAHVPEIGRTGAERFITTCILLFAFALQSYVTQTHIHHARVAAGRAAIVQVVGKVFVHSASPVDDGATACPFCRAIAAAGAFFNPPAIALRLLAAQVEAAALPPFLVGLAIAPAGFSSRSRAPPRS